MFCFSSGPYFDWSFVSPLFSGPGLSCTTIECNVLVAGRLVGFGGVKKRFYILYARLRQAHFGAIAVAVIFLSFSVWRRGTPLASKSERCLLGNGMRSNSKAAAVCSGATARETCSVAVTPWCGLYVAFRRTRQAASPGMAAKDGEWSDLHGAGWPARYERLSSGQGYVLFPFGRPSLSLVPLKRFLCSLFRSIVLMASAPHRIRKA